MTTVNEVERRTGLDFFSALPDEEERQLESEVASARGQITKDCQLNHRLRAFIRGRQISGATEH
jgi:hypothetical protein